MLGKSVYSIVHSDREQFMFDDHQGSDYQKQNKKSMLNSHLVSEI
jgi:hypothetical protein